MSPIRQSFRFGVDVYRSGQLVLGIFAVMHAQSKVHVLGIGTVLFASVCVDKLWFRPLVLRFGKNAQQDFQCALIEESDQAIQLAFERLWWFRFVGLHGNFLACAGQRAIWQHRYEAALDHFYRALSLDPSVGVTSYMGLLKAYKILGRNEALFRLLRYLKTEYAEDDLVQYQVNAIMNTDQSSLSMDESPPRS